MREKEEAKKTISIEIMEKTAEVKLLKGELKRAKGNQVVTGTIQARLALLESFVKEQKVLDKTVKEKYKEAQENVSSAKKLLEALKIERGKPESSIMTEVELTLKKIHIICIISWRRFQRSLLSSAC